MEWWPHQSFALDEMSRRVKPGVRLCVTSPTGGGKSLIMAEQLRRSGSAVLYTNRKMLLEQTARVLESQDIRFGIRAAGHPTDFSKPIQLASIQTTDSRTIKRSKWPLPDAELVVIDEAHVNRERTMEDIVGLHLERGAAVVGFTATPIGIGHFYDDLVVAGVTSELRACGALVPAHYYAPDEPDTAQIKRTKTGEYTYGDIVKAIMTHSIVGRVIEHWRRLNPDGFPTMLFAPGVKESLWFAEQLTAEGIPAAHIDGEQVWMGGELKASDRFERDALKERLSSGEIKVVCNRFVLREGVDWPFVRHIICATMFGALTSYIQSLGRGLRACPSVGKDHVVIQDHGGNYHRHGSINSDREWNLDDTDYVIGEMRENRMREKKEMEPILCPKCMAVRARGPACLMCGFAHTMKSRMVVQTNGTLREVKGDVYKPRRIDRSPIDEVIARWKSCYFRMKRTGGTFNQARGLYAYENRWMSPPPDLPMMPRDEKDWFLPIADVPMSRLTQ